MSVFTFGSGHECVCGRSLYKTYTTFEADETQSARTKMFVAWGVKWSMEYETPELAGAAKYGLEHFATNTTDPSRCLCGAASNPEYASEDPYALQSQRDAWLEDLPSNVRGVAEKFPPWNCYKSLQVRGHYRIYSYDARPLSEVVLLTMVHGQDSFLPGVAVFGVDPADIELCGCGKWSFPTKAQIDNTRTRLEDYKGSAESGCSDPKCAVCATN